ncbi:hypothetical protein [Pseudothermotoga sp.]|uniref:hypothetical protein n=1 Tax=Pseudothermotoga sp. TaxID=2033661 RepID=UPI0031F622AA
MARRLIRFTLLTLTFVMIAWFIPSYWNWYIETERMQEHFVDVCLSLIEVSLEKIVVESLSETYPPELAGYVEIAKKLGGYVGFDPKLGKAVVATRVGTTVKIASFTMNLSFSNFVYYVCDPSGVVIISSEKVMEGKRIDLALPNLQGVNSSMVKYKGRQYLFKQKNNERYGFRILAGIPYKNVAIHGYVVLTVVVGLLSIFLFSLKRSDLSEDRFIQIVQEIIDKRKFDEKSIKNKQLREQLFKLVNKLERNERLLKETVEKLEKLKQLLEAKKDRS